MSETIGQHEHSDTVAAAAWENPFESPQVKPETSESSNQLAKKRAAWCLMVGFVVNNLLYVFGLIKIYEVVTEDKNAVSEFGAAVFLSLLITTAFLSTLPIAWITKWCARNRTISIIAMLFLHCVNFGFFYCMCIIMAAYEFEDSW